MNKNKNKNKDKDKDNITNITNITNVTYLLKTRRTLWIPFKTICTARGITIKNQLNKLILDFVKENAPKHFGTVTIQQIQVNQVNLYNFIMTQEIQLLIDEIKSSVKRKAGPVWLNELRKRLLDLCKKHPTVTPELGEEIKAALTLIRGAS